MSSIVSRFAPLLLTPILLLSGIGTAFGQVSDVNPPQLVGLSFDTNAIDVSSGSQTVTVTLHVTDNLSGASYVGGSFSHSSGQNVGFYGVLISGTPLDGIYEATATFPEHSAAGLWQAYVQLSDNAGNGAYLPAPTLAAAGFPTDVTVTSVIPDTTAPTVSSISFNPAGVDVSSGLVPVTVSLTLSDDITGVALGPYSVNTDFALTLVSPDTHPGAQQRIYLSSYDFNLVSGDQLSGVWEGTFNVPRYSMPGTWEIESLILRDGVNNSVYLDRYSLNDLGVVAANLFVTDSTPDPDAPSLTGFSIAPGAVDTSTGPRTVTATISASDSPAGVSWAPTTTSIAYIQVGAVSPSGQQSSYYNPFVDPVRTAGTAFNGTWQVPLSLPQYAEAGTWKISFFSLKDSAGNQQYFDSNALESAGFNPRFVVTKPTNDVDGTVGPAGGTVTDAVFGPRATATFPPGVLSVPTSVALDVFPDPLALPDPRGFTGAGSFFMNVAFTPRPPSPLPAPGITLVLPLKSPMAPGLPLSLYHLDPVTGTLAPARNYLGVAVVGTVNGPDGTSATFLNVVTLSTVVAYISDGTLLGDVNGDAKVDCADLAVVKAAFGKRKGQAKYNPLADINNDNIVDIKDLTVVSKQLAPKTVCR